MPALSMAMPRSKQAGRVQMERIAGDTMPRVFTGPYRQGPRLLKPTHLKRAPLI